MENVQITKQAYITTTGEKFLPLHAPLRLIHMPYAWNHRPAVRFREHTTHRLYESSNGELHVVWEPVNSQWAFYCQVERFYG